MEWRSLRCSNFLNVFVRFCGQWLLRGWDSDGSTEEQACESYWALEQHLGDEAVGVAFIANKCRS